MSLKAAEVGHVLPFAIHILRQHGGARVFGPEMIHGGETLQTLLNLVREHTCVVPRASHQLMLSSYAVGRVEQTGPNLEPGAVRGDAEEGGGGRMTDGERRDGWRDGEREGGREGRREAAEEEEEEDVVFSALRVDIHGSPKMYNCFIDESLNASLRDVAKYSHRMTFEVR
eukprot:7516546-Pyramimonas_sp.AAC.1